MGGFVFRGQQGTAAKGMMMMGMHIRIRGHGLAREQMKPRVHDLFYKRIGLLLNIESNVSPQRHGALVRRVAMGAVAEVLFLFVKNNIGPDAV